MTAAPTIRIAALRRYPVKGLSPEELSAVDVTAGETLPFDRAYAIENGPGPFDQGAPAHLPKFHFVMLMRNEQLASLRSVFDETTHDLALSRGGHTVATGNLREAEGRGAIETFIARFMPDALRGPPRVVSAAGHSFSDVADKCLHIVNLASVRALEEAMGVSIDPLRFRANIYFDGAPAWSEFDWVGHELSAGPVLLEAFKRTGRCAATNVDPATGVRDLKIPSFLSRNFGHNEFGIYARVHRGGRLALGDRIGV